MTTVEEQLKNAIDPREFDSPGFQHDPFPLYKRLRDHHPIYHDRFHNRWIISRYNDVVAAFRADDSYTRAAYKEDGLYTFGKRHVFGPNILEYGSGPQHRWIRNIVAGQFVAKNLERALPIIDQIAKEVIGTFAKAGEVELVSQFTTQFPIRVVSNLLALPRRDEDTFVEWYQALIAGLGFGAENLASGIQARNEIWDYMDPIIEERSKNPGEDLVSRIATAELRGKRMSKDEIKGFITLMLAGGGDTTDKAIANMWYHMRYTRPDQFEAVRAKSELWSTVFTEMMRYDPVVHTQTRFTTREIAMYDEVIPERAMVTLSLGAANRDDRVFKNPDTFDIHRDDLHMGQEVRSGRYPDGKPGQLGFGLGPHFCMGYAAARQEAVISSTRLLEAMKNPRPKFPTHDGITSPSIDLGGFRSPTELWIEFDVD